MRTIEKYIRKQRLEKRYYFVVYFGEKLLDFYPDSILIREEIAISYFWLNSPNLEFRKKRLEKAISMVNFILQSRVLDDEIIKRSLFNHSLFIKELEELYQNENFDFHFDSFVLKPSSIPLLTFSITTCRRIFEFKKTMDTFLKNFQDIDLICRWICIDDNSSNEDREEMKFRYPFFEFVWKTYEEKGHPKSLQIITKMVDTPYLLHLEDDRMLIDKRNYVKDMLDILDYDSNIGQVVFNHNYSESATDNIKGGFEKTTFNNVKYFEHEYCPNEILKNAFLSRHGNVNNCNYYPHFSLSPSIINTKIFKKIQFKDELKFEFMFALRYENAGFKTAFLPGYHFKHIGRLTSDKTSLKCNAYDFLNFKQFLEPLKYKSFLINLDRRNDRLERIKTFSNLLPSDLKRVSACDGKDLIKTKRLRSFCKNCDYAMRPGVIGCALSHLKLYKNLLEDEKIDGYLIFEDDISPSDDFLPKLYRSFSILQNKNEIPDLIFFSAITKPNHEIKEGIFQKNSREQINEDFIGGTGCYYISKKGAKTTFNYIEKNTLNVAIDAVLYNISNEISTYFVQPKIISQIDPLNISDIQNDHFEKSFLLDEEITAEMFDDFVIFGKNNEIDLFDFIKFKKTEIKNDKQISMKMYKASEF
jgi:GR25 family glycosyltransferase involved in LPS biosynthesis